MTALEIYVITSMIFAVAALIEFAIVIAIYRLEQTKKCIMEPRANRLLDVEKDLFSEGLKFRNKVKARGNHWTKKKCQDEEPKKIMNLPSLSIDKIDFLAFWSFLFVYVLFNACYWVLYLLK